MDYMKYYLLPILALSLMACSTRKGPARCDELIPASDGRPTLLIVGDSISIGYMPYIADGLSDYQVVHNPCNAQNTDHTVHNIDIWLSFRPRFDAITFNNGLWDVATFAHTYDYEYYNNLKRIAQKVKAKTDRPLFILTTEVPVNTPYRSDAEVIRKNAVARQVMQEEGIPVVDLYTLSKDINYLHINPAAQDDVHFTPEGSAVLGAYILDALTSIYGVN